LSKTGKGFQTGEECAAANQIKLVVDSGFSRIAATEWL
jgi:hypothetical protein